MDAEIAVARLHMMRLDVRGSIVIAPIAGWFRAGKSVTNLDEDEVRLLLACHRVTSCVASEGLPQEQIRSSHYVDLDISSIRREREENSCVPD
jgi:hypothetical protein